MMGGDMNAKIGQSEDQFQKKYAKLWTHIYPNGVKAQLDYMLVNRKWINSLMNCEAYGILPLNWSAPTIVSYLQKFNSAFEPTNQMQLAPST